MAHITYSKQSCPLHLYENGKFAELSKGLAEGIWEPDQLLKAIISASIKADEDWISKFLDAFKPLGRDLGRGKTILHTILGTKQHEEESDSSRSILVSCILCKQHVLSKGDCISRFINRQDRCRRTALYFAVKNNLIACARALIDEGANVNIQCTADRVTPVMVAAKQGNTVLLEILLEKGADLSRGCLLGQSALIVACSAGTIDCVKLLLRYHAPKEARDPGGMTALMHACNAGQREIVQTLVERGAKLDAVDHIKNSSPMFAIKAKSIEILQYLLRTASPPVLKAWQSDCRLVEIAVAYDQVKLLKALIDAKWDLTRTSLSGWSVLHCAVDCRPPMTECFKFLMDAREEMELDVNARANDGETPLHAACGAFNHDVLPHLLSLGADPDLCNRDSETPLSKCLVSLYMDCFEIDASKLLCAMKLLRYGCDVLIGIDRTVKGIFKMIRVSLWNQVHPGSMEQFFKNKGPKQLVRIILDILYCGIRGDKQPFRDALLNVFDADAPIDERMKVLPVYEWTRYFETPTLFHITRDAVRASLRCNAEESIKTLPVPVHLHSFLNLSELEELKGEYEEVMRENFRESYFDATDDDEGSLTPESSESYEVSTSQTESESGDSDADYHAPAADN